MGIFSDRCESLIDAKTGLALQGEALKQAMLDPAWPRCGSQVRKAAMGCSKCGAPAPGGWRKCAGCGSWCGNESNFCWKCRKPLHPEDQTAVADGLWQRPAGLLAKRLDVGDIKTMLHKNRIVVEEGSAALLLQGGRYKDVLKAGTHTLDSLGHRINHWGDPPPRTVVLVDAGDIAVPVRVEGLRSSEDVPVELYAEIHLRVAPSDKAAEAFVASALKDSRELNVEQFVALFKNEIRYAVANICTTSTVDDLFRDPARRLRVEDELQQTVERSAKVYGFEVVHVSYAEFSGPEYEGLRKRSGEVEIKRRSLEFDQRLRELLQKERMHEFKTQQDLDEYVAQMAHERDVSDDHRTHELALLRLVQRGELDAKAAAMAMALEMEKTAHEISRKLKWDEYTNRAMLDKEKAEADATLVWLKVREEKERIRLATLAAETKILEGKDLQTLLAVLPPDRHAALLQAQQMMMLKGLNEKQTLAILAKDNPDLARVLLENARAEGAERERDFTEKKRILDESADRLERVMNKALETTAQAAKGQGSTTQVIK